MKKDEIIACLIEHRAELTAAGAEHIYLFGSFARQQEGPASDLDILVKLADPVVQSGFGYYSALEDLKDRIAEMTGMANVDIVAEPLRRADVRERVERDRVVAF